MSLSRRIEFESLHPLFLPCSVCLLCYSLYVGTNICLSDALVFFYHKNIWHYSYLFLLWSTCSAKAYSLFWQAKMIAWASLKGIPFSSEPSYITFSSLFFESWHIHYWVMKGAASLTQSFWYFWNFVETCQKLEYLVFFLLLLDGFQICWSRAILPQLFPYIFQIIKYRIPYLIWLFLRYRSIVDIFWWGFLVRCRFQPLISLAESGNRKPYVIDGFIEFSGHLITV